MPSPYQRLAAALSEDGIRCQFQTRNQLVVSRQVGPIWPDRGNSFWVTPLAGRWYLFTWGPVGYAVPVAGDIAALCRTCTAHGNRAMPQVPPPILEEFALVELSAGEAAAVYRAMDGRP
jgi:hypothetical protein